MALNRSGTMARIWRDFQAIFAEFAGISIQAFDAKGVALPPAPRLPSLCSYLHRQPETFAACQKDCFRKALTCKDSRRTLAARCYAGLSYRVVPVRRLGVPLGVIIVGRVLTEVLGEEQRRGFIGKYKLPPQAFLESHDGLLSLGSGELDRVAAFVRTLAVSFVAAETRLEQRHRLLAQRGDLLDIARKASACEDPGAACERRLLESLVRALGASGAALLLPAKPGGGREVLTSVGLGEESLHVLAGRDWQSLFEQAGGDLVAYARREQMVGAGFDLPQGSLAAQRLAPGAREEGLLAVAGAPLGRRELDLIGSAAGFIGAHLAHRRFREAAAENEQESALLGRLAERCLIARDVEEILPLALEAAMHHLHAKRGSILLAEERGRITARALRGDHAPISGSIEVIPPGSVSHRVFFDRLPILVHDVEREPELKREREFPYTSRSFVSVPLRDNGRALGVLHLTEREGEEAFTPRDLAWLERLGLQTSGAIRKVRLEREVEMLRVASTSDHLTGAGNRRHLEEQLPLELQRARRFGKPLAVAMLDIDGFKALNDEFGHDFGDQVLRQVADVVRQQLRSVDVLARYGGDEFALILPGTGEEGAAAIAERIRTRVEAAGLPEPAVGRMACTVSLGLAVSLDAAEAAESLLQRADQALLQAKKSGRNAALLWSGAPA